MPDISSIANPPLIKLLHFSCKAGNLVSSFNLFTIHLYLYDVFLYHHLLLNSVYLQWRYSSISKFIKPGHNFGIYIIT
jgi:hypothetical protein